MLTVGGHLRLHANHVPAQENDRGDHLHATRDVAERCMLPRGVDHHGCQESKEDTFETRLAEDRSQSRLECEIGSHVSPIAVVPNG